MGSIGRYIFRTTFGAFLVICASVTALDDSERPKPPVESTEPLKANSKAIAAPASTRMPFEKASR